MKNLVRGLFLLAMFCLISKLSFSQMRQVHVDQTVADNDVRKISFYSASSGFVAFRDWIGFTTDTGRTFVRKPITISNVDYNGYSVNLTFGFGINGVKAFNKDTIIAYGDYGFVPAILYSTNGGSTYKLIFQSLANQLQFNDGITDMVFPQDNNIGFAVDADRILKTTNKGLSWSVVLTFTGANFTNLESVNNNNVFVFSTDIATNKLWKTTNGGTNWQGVTYPTNNSNRLTYAYFLTPTKGWLNTRDNDNKFYLYQTTNGGGSWTLQNDPVEMPISSHKMKFVNDTTGYAITGLFTTMKTTNAGKLWEFLPRDNVFTHLGFGFNDLATHGEDQLWSGGGHGFLELSTNGGGTPLPKAYFKVDTTNSYLTNNVQLLNLSRPTYQFKWFVNGVQISTAYNTSYTHNPLRAEDSIQLVVSNGTHADTLLQVQRFPPPVIITSFAPTNGAQGTVVTINGQNFIGTNKVTFGGVQANGFTVISNTQIRANVGSGATGSVMVIKYNASGSLGGFTYFAPAEANLPTSFSKTILCKQESITVTLQNTEADVRYEMIDSTGTSFGGINSAGGTVSFSTALISRSGNYRITAVRTNVNASITYSNKFFFSVEKTKSAFATSYTNVEENEPVNFFQRSSQAQSFSWSFGQGASIATSNAPNPTGVFYSGTGPKNITLVSTSVNGCKDTFTTAAIAVYTKPLSAANCYVQNVDDSDYFYTPYSPPSINEINLATDSGYFISGKGNKPLLKSRLGIGKKFTTDGVAYFAKYTTDGVLRWHMNIESGGFFYAAENDPQGNIYITGSSHVLSYLTLPNGDTLRISATPGDVVPWSHKQNGFVLKLDAQGNYLWHTVLDDITSINTGYQVLGGQPYKLKVVNNRIVLGGRFYSNLTYYRNGVRQTLVSLSNSASLNTLQNLFVIKIKDNGTLMWHSYYENNATNQLFKIGGLGLDKQGNTFVLGAYEQKVIIRDAAGTSITLGPNSYSYKSYLIKMDSLGIHQWLAKYPGEPRGLVVDSNGTTYTTGSGGILQVTNADNTTINPNVHGYHVLKFSPQGMNLWAVGTESAYYGYGDALVLKGNNLYTTGTVSQNGPTSSSFLFTSADGAHQLREIYSSEIFIATYDTLGGLKRVASSGNTHAGMNSMHPNRLLIDASNNFLLTGMSGYTSVNTYNMFGSPLTTRGIDGFFAKLNPDFCYSQTPPFANAGQDRLKCAGDTTRIGVAATGNTYYWTSQPAGFTSTLPNPVVTPMANTTYFLTVTNAGGLSARDTVVVSTQASPIANAGTDRTICRASNTTLGAAATAGLSYSWTSSPAGFTSTESNPTVSPAVTTKYYLTVTNTNGCIGRDTVTVQAVDAVTPSVSISGHTAFCNGFNSGYTASYWYGGTTPSFQWQVNGVNVGTNSTSYSNSTLVTGDVVRVIMTSSEACVTQRSDTAGFTVTVHPNTVPAVSISSSVSGTVCQGSTVVFTASPTNGGSNPTYQWQVNGTNAGINSSTYSTTSLRNGDQVKVVMRSGAQCPNPLNVTSNSITMVMDAANAGPDKFICAGSNNTVIGTPAVAGYTYAWSPATGLSSSSVAQPIVSALVNTTYSLTITSPSGCTASDNVSIYVHSLPQAPVITLTGNLLTSSSVSGNQWYKDGVAITGSTSVNHIATASGIYTATVNNGICTSLPSNSIQFATTAISSPTLYKEFVIGPNPVTNKLNVQYSGPASPFRLEAMEMSGKKVLPDKKFSKSFELNMTGLSAGSYIIKIVNERTKEQIQRLIVKQ